MAPFPPNAWTGGQQRLTGWRDANEIYSAPPIRSCFIVSVITAEASTVGEQTVTFQFPGVKILRSAAVRFFKFVCKIKKNVKLIFSFACSIELRKKVAETAKTFLV
ncbi:hypothetical protein LJC22_07175 [Desulfosarcina sp. OttesenSCG-928-G10]|nr:hypothetical protein [Desulfosarcina sp. OttesenSCG-928-G10]MDL2321772.1 hypothetical protein [Desulfosarcina sp. OttesenSCG-928-B08]